MTNRDFYLYEMALRVANHSLHAKYKMAAVVFKSGRILSRAVNGKRTGRHAEIRALSKDIDFNGSTIVVARVGGLRVSKPCRTCFRLIKEVGCKWIVYIDLDGRFSKVKVINTVELEYRDYYEKQNRVTQEGFRYCKESKESLY